MVKVMNATQAAHALASRARDNPGGIPVAVGWDGARIAFYADLRKPNQTLPNTRLVVTMSMSVDEIETALALAVAEIRPALQQALTSGAPRRSGNGNPGRLMFARSARRE